MATSLSRTNSIKLEQCLDQWPRWQMENRLKSRPHIIRVLPGGDSNTSVMVAAPDNAFIVRLDGIKPSEHGINRQGEYCAMQHAAAAQLAPLVRYFNPQLGVIVSDYLTPDTPSPPLPADTAALLNAIHQLPGVHHRLDLQARIRMYERQVDTNAPASLDKQGAAYKQLSALIELAGKRADYSSLCHNDLLAANRIYSCGKLWAIDWEYAAMGSPWYDLAASCYGDQLSNEQIHTVLKTYLGRTASNAELRKLMEYGCLFHYICLLWQQREYPDNHATAQAEQQRLLGLLTQLDTFTYQD